MAITFNLSGDRLQIPYSIVPKKPITAYAATARVGHYVKLSSAGNDQVARCADGDAIYGMVWSINSGNGVLSVLRLNKVQSLVMEYLGQTCNLLDRVVSKGTDGTIPIGNSLRDVVKQDNTNGTGVVVAKDSPATGLVVVEFGAYVVGSSAGA